MINSIRTKELLKEFAWECYEFWANELDTDNDKYIWPKVIDDLNDINHDPYSLNGERLDQEAKTEFIKQLKNDLNI